MGDQPVNGPGSRQWALWHKLWSKSAHGESYNKAEWKELGIMLGCEASPNTDPLDLSDLTAAQARIRELEAEVAKFYGAGCDAIDGNIARDARIAQLEAQRDEALREQTERADELEKECDAAHARLRERTGELTAAQARIRTTAQILIAEVGAVGPENAEDAARRAVARIRELEVEREQARAEVQRLQNEWLSDRSRVRNALAKCIRDLGGKP